ncbi:IPTL-CTERM sorting domain-containing protein, partial [Ottowia sp.]|uniref:IPTL-CTERM sorting domain-containing protein n=1 Tax=Ottowia sp. TaxID=1898956 RepID=UPI00262A94D8
CDSLNTKNDVSTEPGQLHTTSLNCTINGAPAALGGTDFPYSLTVTAADTNIVCTYTSQRVAAPAGPVAAVPTLGAWTLLLLSLGLVGTGALRQRRAPRW